jgi:catechol 2,3-dioxygenase-like lactoylglutathione lyase family enzyme
MDFKLELVAVPVSDVDRAKAFYVDQAGFNADHDHTVSEEIRFVQLTPPGSACSIAVGMGITEAAPGSAQGLHLVVPDIEAARAELVSRGVDVSEPFHFGAEGKTPGLDPERRDYGSCRSFSDPDRNAWLVQEVRRPQPRP